jgi:hypothetical protein
LIKFLQVFIQKMYRLFTGIISVLHQFHGRIVFTVNKFRFWQIIVRVDCLTMANQCANAELADMVFVYGQALGNAAAARRLH